MADETPTRRRFDQCSVGCTTDCGHCKGDPIGALRSRLIEVERQRDQWIETAAKEQRVHLANATKLVAAETDLARMLPVVEAATALVADWRANRATHGGQLTAALDLYTDRVSR